MSAMEQTQLVKDITRPKKKTRKAGDRKVATRKESFNKSEKNPKDSTTVVSHTSNENATSPTVSPRKGRSNKHDKEMKDIFEQAFDPNFHKEMKEALRRFMMCSVFLDIGHMDKAKQSQDIFMRIFREHCQTSPTKVIKLAEKLRCKKRFIESVVMFETAVGLLNNKEENHDNIALFIMECLQQLEDLTKVMVDCTPDKRLFGRDYVVPFMREQLENMNGLANADPEIRFSRYVCSCIFVGFTELNVKDIDGAEASWLRAINACRDFYGENAKKHSILGTCYKNMGDFYATSGRHAEAKGYLKLALEVFKEAEEYENEEERQNDIEICCDMLSKFKI
uniref:Uncharacterized protein LOC108950203 n=1 Tax=Phallusia mammillata TaxID=59560 RepID=A0A6F9DJB0_9ASCI|nr:uncharacterized protein LOC108950203 [Phallusia mammillata]